MTITPYAFPATPPLIRCSPTCDPGPSCDSTGIPPSRTARLDSFPLHMSGRGEDHGASGREVMANARETPGWGEQAPPACCASPVATGQSGGDGSFFTVIEACPPPEPHRPPGISPPASSTIRRSPWRKRCSTRACRPEWRNGKRQADISAYPPGVARLSLAGREPPSCLPRRDRPGFPRHRPEDSVFASPPSPWRSPARPTAP